MKVCLQQQLLMKVSKVLQRWNKPPELLSSFGPAEEPNTSTHVCASTTAPQRQIPGSQLPVPGFQVQKEVLGGTRLLPLGVQVGG